MAPLSRELAGLILPHDQYGTHLNESGKTIDEAREKQNFQFAGKTLAEVWSSMTIDNHPVCTSYITPDQSEVSEESLQMKDMIWRAKHVCESQYMTQIVKCDDPSCCVPARSDYFKFVPNRFLPPPIPLVQSERGLVCPDYPTPTSDTRDYKFPSLFVNLALSSEILPMNAKSFKKNPYDLYCPSVQKILSRRIYNKCSTYSSSIVRSMIHQRTVCEKKVDEKKVDGKKVDFPKLRPVRTAAKRAREVLAVMIQNEELEWVDEDYIEFDSSQLEMKQAKKTDESMAVICIEKHMSVPWEDEI